MARYVHLRPERHAIGVAALELYSQIQVAVHLWNTYVYYNVAVIFRLTITYTKYNITLQYVYVITRPSHRPSMLTR